MSFDKQDAIIGNDCSAVNCKGYCINTGLEKTTSYVTDKLNYQTTN